MHTATFIAWNNRRSANKNGIRRKFLCRSKPIYRPTAPDVRLFEFFATNHCGKSPFPATDISVSQNFRFVNSRKNKGKATPS